MNEILYNVLIQVGVYLIVIFLTILIFNFLTKGYLFTYIRVKASRGNKVLVRILSFTGYYYRAGSIDQSVLTFKNKQKNEDSYKIAKEDIFQEMLVNCVCVDETTKKVLKIDGNSEEGHDTEKFSSLLQRALYKPSFKDNPKEMFMLFLLVGIAGGIVFIIYLLMTAKETAFTVGVV